MRSDIRDQLSNLTHTLPQAVDGDFDVSDILQRGRRARRARRVGGPVAAFSVAAAGLAAVVAVGPFSGGNEPRLEVLGQPGTTIAASEFSDRVRDCAADAGLNGNDLTTEQGGRALQWDGPSDAQTISRVNAVMDECVAQFVVDPADTRFEAPGPKDRPDGFADWSAQHPDAQAARHRIRDDMIECLTGRGVTATRLGDEFRLVYATETPSRAAIGATGQIVVACEAAHDPRQPWAVEESAENLDAQRVRVANLEAQVEQLEDQLQPSNDASSSDDADDLEREIKSVRKELEEARRWLNLLQTDAEATP